MHKQTLIFTALPNGHDPQGRARVSVLASPRLWTGTDADSLPLSTFPDLLDWPTRVVALSWQAELDDGSRLPLQAAPVDVPAMRALWSALFRADTRVQPYVFEDFRGTPIVSAPFCTLHDLLADLYARASSDPAYGAGAERPALEVLAADPDIGAVAETWVPDPVPEPSPPGTGTPPFPDAPRHTEEVPVWSSPDDADDAPPPGCGCLTWPFGLARWLLGKMFGRPAPWVDSDEPPVEPGPPTSTPLPTASFDTSVLHPPPPPAPDPPRSFVPPPPASALHAERRAAFDALDAFLQPFDETDLPLPDAAELAARWDIHQAIAALGDFPELLRRLGLVIDLQVADGHVLDDTVTGVRVLPSGVSWALTTTMVSPRTEVRVDTAAGRFVAAPRPSAPEIVDGFLRVDDSARFRVIQNDVVGDANKVRNAATRILRFGRKADRTFGTPDTAGLPALRTAGISLVRRDTAGDLARQFERSCALNRHVAQRDRSTPPDPVDAPPPVADGTLYAEDLVRGYRIDVFDATTGRWRSLCERSGTYRFLEAQPALVSVTATDEGFVQLATTAPRDPAAPKSLRVGETLFTWNGWSLAAPRPGLAIMPDDRHVDPENDAMTPFRVEADIHARPGSLPRLRFGREYRLRARAADLAGNSVVGPQDAAYADDGPAVTAPFTAVRYEPVAPPVTMLQRPSIEGESLERMVVRTPAEGVPRPATTRHVAPPRAAQLTAELHGALDGVGFDGSPASHTLSARESARVEDGAERCPPDIELQPDLPAPDPAQFPWVQAADRLVVAYLPDPQVHGVLFDGLPGETAPDGLRRIEFTGTWPDLDAFRIRLLAAPEGAAPAAPEWQPAGDTASGVLTVHLAPAQRAVVRFNSVIDPDDLQRRGVWDWTERQAPANLTEVRDRAAAGQHWAHMPWRELILVHAVQQPLRAPTAAIVPVRGPGATDSGIGGSFEAEPASTGRVQLRARWVDWVDDLARPVPELHTREALVGESRVPEVAGPAPFEDANAEPGEAGPTDGPPASILLRHEFHDTRHHAVAYTPVGVTRFREYFPPSTNTEANTTRAGAAAPVDVPSSARPEPPRFLYAVPVFHWDTRPATPGRLERTREAGLRLYFDRPWYSSGNGELLGVVFLDDEPFPGADDPRAAWATVWAGDPIWRGASGPGSATRASFPGAVAACRERTVPDGGATRVSVAGFKPEFDLERRLWRVDVRIETGDVYWPFVRLALARFQPKSLKGVELSAVRRTPFLQIPPRRHAVLTVADGSVSIRVEGPAPVASEASRRYPAARTARNGLNEIEAVVERLRPGGDIDDPLSWMPLEASRLMMVQAPTAPGLWQGTLSLAEASPSGRYRVSLREYEWFRSDDADPDAGDRDLRFARRLIYADVFVLD
ncbi:hypothetical protein ACF3M1_04850 [Luteimonas sp. WGS1318]|uniref:hypothetical protein n=1 Tax=Luteimonas sp. WGS1318 TaxID=3366815 RepID=UPI00372D5382